MVILPVFAGMIPTAGHVTNHTQHSPRIRGDDPSSNEPLMLSMRFSPYSRG